MYLAIRASTFTIKKPSAVKEADRSSHISSSAHRAARLSAPEAAAAAFPISLRESPTLILT